MGSGTDANRDARATRMRTGTSAHRRIRKKTLRGALGALAAVWLATAGHAASATLTVSPPATESIELSAGTARELAFQRDVDSAFIADEATADVNVLDKRTLFLVGKSPGITTLRLYDSNSQVIGAYTVRVHAQSGYAQAIVEKIAGADSGITVEAMGNMLFVTGTAKSPSQAERLLRSIEGAVPVPVINALSLETPAQVNLEVLISEVARNVTTELGIDWSVDLNPFENPLRTLLTGTGIRIGTGALRIANIYDHVITFTDPNADEDDPQFTQEVSELGVENPLPRGSEGGIVLSRSREFNSGKYRATAFLEALAQNGLLVLHTRPNLTTVSGQPAEFFSGLEIPTPSITDRGVVGTVYRQTGVNLVFTPTVLDRNQISLVVEPRIREVAAGGTMIAGAAVPNINERSARATIELGDGESIAIAGLYGRNITSSESGIPLLKDLPVWGTLFRSGTDTERVVELIIVVTARIVAAVPAPDAAAANSTAGTVQQLRNALYY